MVYREVLKKKRTDKPVRQKKGFKLNLSSSGSSDEESASQPQTESVEIMGLGRKGRSELQRRFLEQSRDNDSVVIGAE